MRLSLISSKICLLLYIDMWAVFDLDMRHTVLYERKTLVFQELYTQSENLARKEKASPLNERRPPTLPKRHQQRYSGSKQTDKLGNQEDNLILNTWKEDIVYIDNVTTFVIIIDNK